MNNEQHFEQDVRRHDDNSIDFDFYRTRSTALRRQAMRDAHTLRMATLGSLVMVGAVGFAMVIPSIAASPVGDRIAMAFSSLSQTR
jgi:hypothetical protein